MTTSQLITGRPEIRRLRNSPLIHVVAQIVFSPDLGMADKVGHVQAGLRSLKLIKTKRSEVQVGFTLQLGAGSTVPKIDTKTRWDFLDRDSSCIASLTESFLVLQTSRYSHFEQFRDFYRSMLEVLAERTGVSWVERVALRYVNLVRIARGERFEKYLKPELLGYGFAHLPHGREQSVFGSRAVAPTPAGKLQVGCYHVTPPGFLPSDLLPSDLSYPTWVTTPAEGELRALLDIDHFSEAGFEFSIPETVERLERLHYLIRATFLDAVTSHAKTVWGPEEEVSAR